MLKFPNPRFPSRRCLRIALMALPFTIGWLVLGTWFAFSERMFIVRRDLVGQELVGLLLPLCWLPLFGNLLAVFGLLRSRGMDAAFRVCLHCGHDLRGSPSGRCPECGAADAVPPKLDGDDSGSEQ